MHRKILGLWIYFTTMFVYNIQSQPINSEIIIADSLLVAQKYPEALQMYNSIFSKSGQYTLSMLIKLAMLAEDQGDCSLALFYLNIYYKERPDKSVLRRMEQLAEQYKLEGYNYTDVEYFRSLYNEYYYSFILYLLTAASAYFLYLLYKKSKQNKLGLRPVLFIALLISVYLVTNYRITRPRAIIANNSTCLMTSPSSAAEVMGMTQEGHRVTLTGKKDIWYQIAWNGKQAYVREDQLHIIPQKQKSLF